MKMGNIFFSLFLLALAGYVLYTASHWSFKAGFFPLAIAVPLLLLAVLHFVLDLFGKPEAQAERVIEAEFSNEVPAAEARRRALVTFSWIALFIALVYLVSFPLAVPLFLFLYLRLQSKISWSYSMILTGVAWLAFYTLFERLIKLQFAPGEMQTLLGI